MYIKCWYTHVYTQVQSNLIWNSRDSSIKGFATSSEDIKSLHDVYEGLLDDELCQKANDILQFLWRDLASSYDVIGPYFSLASSIEATVLHPFITSTMVAFHKYGFYIRCILCDGASSNLSLLKSLGGIEDGNITSSSFVSPLDGKNVYMIICPYAPPTKYVTVKQLLLNVCLIYYFLNIWFC